MKWIREDLVSKRMGLFDKGRSACVLPRMLTIYAGRKKEKKAKETEGGGEGWGGGGVERNSGWKPKCHTHYRFVVKVLHIYGLSTGVMHFLLL